MEGLRAFSGNMAMAGGAMVAAGAAIALPLKGLVEEAASVDEAMQHLKTNLDPARLESGSWARLKSSPKRCR